MITLFYGQKGGNGKSLTSENYAAELANRGETVCLVDADPQCTSADWVSYREEDETLITITCIQKRGKLIKTLRELDERFDHVVVDVAGRADDDSSKEMRSALVVAHVAIAPFKPDQPSLNTLPKVEQILDEAMDFNPDLKAFSLITIAPTHHAVTETQESKEILESCEAMQLLDTIIYDRKVYRDAYSQGKSVVEIKHKAGDEIRSLVTEVLERVNASTEALERVNA